MKINFHLHGILRTNDGLPVTMDVRNMAEAIKALSQQVSSFKPDPINGYKRVIAQGFETLESLFKDFTDEIKDVHIFPQLCGGKKGGFLQILIGAALIAASFIPGVGAFAPILLQMGALMVIGGLLQLMNAPKRDQKDAETNKSYYLGSPKNTVEIGTRIPILYGKRRIGGHYLSFDITSTTTGF